MEHLHKQIIRTILEIERAASERFNKGDVSGYLDIYHDDVTYVDPMTPSVLTDKNVVRAYFDKSYLGVQIEKAEWSNINVVVNESANTAILTYNQQNHIRSKNDDELHQIPLWNCTEVYRLTDGQWKIAHANWSFAQHPVLLNSLNTLFTQLGYV